MFLALTALALLGSQDSVPTRAPSVSPVGTVRVRVVQGPKKDPVAGAEVRGFISPEYVGLLSMDSFYRRLEPALQNAIRLGSTDGNGELVVAIGGNCVLVEASSEDQWGATRVLTEVENSLPIAFVHEIELRADFDLSVRVVDAHDRPLAGIAVTHRVEYEFQGSRFRSDSPARTTDGQGSVLMHHLGYEMRTAGGADKDKDLIAIASCLQPAVETLVDLAHLPTEPIVLRMPPTGEIELAFEEADGTPIPIDGDCALALAKDAAESPAYPPFPRILGLRDAGVEVIEHPDRSSVVFHHVSLDADCEVWVQRNAISKAVRGRIHGPHREGERVRAVLQPPGLRLLQGQFVDEKGTPCGVVEFSVQVRWMPPPNGWPEPHGPDGVIQLHGSGGEYEVREDWLGSVFDCGWGPAIEADDHGRFRIDSDITQYAGGDLFLTFVEKRGGSGERSVCIPYEKRQDLGLADLGRLVLAASPVIASGTIRDEAGHPLSGVTVEGSSSSHGVYRFQTASLADGTFYLRGPCFEKYTDLWFSRAGFATLSPSVVKLGSMDLAIVMQMVDPSKIDPGKK